jgi:hypothetical protein
MAYVYLLCDPAQDLYKIGKTKNLASKRMKQLQTGNGTELHVVNTFETEFPFRLEQWLHSIFSSKRAEGEWFALENDDIVNFTKHCEEIMKGLNAVRDNPFVKLC